MRLLSYGLPSPLSVEYQWRVGESGMKGNWMVYAGRALALSWAGFWLWFGVASGIGEKEGVANFVIHTLVPGGIGMLTVLIAWRWTGVGGALLVAEGLFIMLAMAFGRLIPNSVPRAALLLTILALPPFVAGLLLMSSGWRVRTA